MQEDTKMTDEKLIEEIAKIWVDNGGDAEGIDWCIVRIKEAINNEVKGRDSLVDEDE